jgi:hypothetical protein
MLRLPNGEGPLRYVVRLQRIVDAAACGRARKSAPCAS